MTAATLPDGALAGYRLVRRLGSGSRAQVYLGVGSKGSVAIKRFDEHTPRDSVRAELDALGRVDSPHLVRLIDVATEANRVPILVLERLSRGHIAELLAGRDAIALGEAVTLLAPIATLIAELHDAGVAHGRLTASSIHLGANAQPVLLGLGHCQLFEPNGTMAALDAEPSAILDREALARLAIEILARVRDDSTSSRVADLADWIGSTPRRYEFPGDLAERLFASAEPLPISTPRDDGERALPPARVTPLLETKDDSATPPAERPLPDWVPNWLFELVLDSPVDGVKRRLLATVRGVRRRYWVVAGIVAASLILALTLIPTGGSPTASATTDVRPTAAPPQDPAPAPTPLPDDPLQAARVLLNNRATCLRDLSILCLDGVDEASSAAFESDAALIQKIEEGGERSSGPLDSVGQLALTERLGDTALISLGAPSGTASILVIRTKGGWRIRDDLSGLQATPSP